MARAFADDFPKTCREGHGQVPQLVRGLMVGRTHHRFGEATARAPSADLAHLEANSNPNRLPGWTGMCETEDALLAIDRAK